MLAPRHDSQKQCSKLKIKMTENKERQAVANAICNKCFSDNSSILIRSKFVVGRQECSPQFLLTYSLNR